MVYEERQAVPADLSIIALRFGTNATGKPSATLGTLTGRLDPSFEEENNLWKSTLSETMRLAPGAEARASRWRRAKLRASTKWAKLPIVLPLQTGDNIYITT